MGDAYAAFRPDFFKTGQVGAQFIGFVDDQQLDEAGDVLVPDRLCLRH